VDSFGDTDCGLSRSACELAWFLMCMLLVIQTVACLVSEGELAWVLMCPLLVTETVACYLSDGELALVFLVLFCGNIYFGASFLGGELL
jgi:hypothetical protein